MKASLDGPRDWRFNSTDQHPRESIIQLGKIVNAGRKTGNAFFTGYRGGARSANAGVFIGRFSQKAEPDSVCVMRRVSCSSELSERDLLGELAFEREIYSSIEENSDFYSPERIDSGRIHPHQVSTSISQILGLVPNSLNRTLHANLHLG